MKINTPNADDYTTAPIRSYSEIVQIMRSRGDATITVSQIHYYLDSAFRKIRKALESVKDEL
jgi:hypothetical protein